MKILIDADGCPVVAITTTVAKQCNIECLIVCDTSHVFEDGYAQTIILSKGADSVDFALVNMINIGDIVVTQDYGLAAMALARSAKVLNQNGMIYDTKNIDALLLSRHISKKIRNGGGRLKGPSKRKTEDDLKFKKALEEILKQSNR